jgi:hypothetical protein
VTVPQNADEEWIKIVFDKVGAKPACNEKGAGVEAGPSPF